MYSTCLFCHAPLGRNTLVESFPVGRRLAFDAAQGRLWVVCRKCERWNLTPLEERWEAIEDCERRYRATRARVSTDQVGLARLHDGDGPLELVRIGRPLRPELAAWRYGDQFGRRRRRYVAWTGAAVVAGGALLVAGPVMGLVSLGVLSPLLNVANAAQGIYSARNVVRVPVDDGAPLTLRREQAASARLEPVADGWQLVFTAFRDRDPTVPWWKFDGRQAQVTLTGRKAVRAARALMPLLNHRGASASQVQEAVKLLEAHASPEALFGATSAAAARRFRDSAWQLGEVGVLKDFPAAHRLALEMIAHEDTERRALEGELALLEAAWKDAEEIARIADDLALPEGIGERLRKLKGG